MCAQGKGEGKEKGEGRGEGRVDVEHCHLSHPSRNIRAKIHIM